MTNRGSNAALIASDCPYCLGRSGDTVLTVEHIWPASLGGRTSPDIFRSDRVCRKCNNLAGIFVDAPFRKSFFIQNEGLAGQEFLDPARPSATALFYMGFEIDFPTPPTEVCERWIGPAGEHIYHIHARDDARWETVAGGDFIRRKTSDGGRAYIVLTSQSQYWAATALISLSEWFPYAKRRCLTRIEGGGNISGVGVLTVNEPPISSREETEIAYICDRPEGHQIHMQMPIQIDFSDRFMVKVALGLSSTILGNRAVQSAYGNDLRTALWGRKPEDRQNLSLRGTNFWRAADERFVELLKLSGAWTILLKALPSAFSYTAVSPTGKMLAMAISNDPQLWPAAVGATYGDGVLYVAIPERQKWVGPISMLSFIAHKLGNYVEPALAELDQLRTLAKSLPPKR